MTRLHWGLKAFMVSAGMTALFLLSSPFPDAIIGATIVSIYIFILSYVVVKGAKNSD